MKTTKTTNKCKGTKGQGYDCKEGKHKIPCGHGMTIKLCDYCFKRYSAAKMMESE